jgi:hypothetical protein
MFSERGEQYQGSGVSKIPKWTFRDNSVTRKDCAACPGRYESVERLA